MNHVGPLQEAGRGDRPDPRRLSALVLRLYEAATVDDVSAFQDRAIAILAEEVPCDGSWWASGVGVVSGYQVHGSHLHNLPDDVPRLYNSSNSANPMARVSAAQPGRAILFRADALYAEPLIAALSRRMRSHQSLCISQIDPASPESLRFLVITRARDDAEFSDFERQWLELLNPHLNAALDLCCAAQMARWRRLHSKGQLLAISDARGLLHLSEPGVREMLRAEWPDWLGDRLPDELVDCLTEGREAFDGHRIHAGFLWSGSRVLLAVRPRYALDSLSPQERAVSQAFASGQSYKMVARAAGIAPATVRHHLRAAYAKLGVSDKAALAQLVFAATASGDAAADADR